MNKKRRDLLLKRRQLDREQYIKESENIYNKTLEEAMFCYHYQESLENIMQSNSKIVLTKKR